ASTSDSVRLVTWVSFPWSSGCCRVSGLRDLIPVCDLILTICEIRHVSRRGRAHPRFGRSVRLLSAAAAIQPVAQMKNFPVGIVVEVRTTASASQNPFAVLHPAVPLGVNFIPAPIQVER